MYNITLRKSLKNKQKMNKTRTKSVKPKFDRNVLTSAFQVCFHILPPHPNKKGPTGWNYSLHYVTYDVFPVKRSVPCVCVGKRKTVLRIVMLIGGKTLTNTMPPQNTHQHTRGAKCPSSLLCAGSYVVRLTQRHHCV